MRQLELEVEGYGREDKIISGVWWTYKLVKDASVLMIHFNDSSRGDAFGTCDIGF